MQFNILAIAAFAAAVSATAIPTTQTGACSTNKVEACCVTGGLVPVNILSCLLGLCGVLGGNNACCDQANSQTGLINLSTCSLL